MFRAFTLQIHPNEFSGGNFVNNKTALFNALGPNDAYMCH